MTKCLLLAGLLCWAVCKGNQVRAVSGAHHRVEQTKQTGAKQGPAKKTPAKAAKAKPAAKPVAKPIASAQDIEEGKALLSKSDCLACHKVDQKLVGPAYMDVAKKYPNTAASVTQLSTKVLSGGSGVWGQVAMAPHPTLPAADAKKMVQYILSLNAK
jgi:cytochrome c